ncbi:MAG: AAA family ATPase [Candidatus Lokiarchaeota archaeon]|nr:AAA family ATPase [Candidatus Harpocratesius repetitus]
MEENNIPWVEKYRPQTTKDMVGFEDIISKLQKFLDDFLELQKKYREIKKQLRATSSGSIDRKIDLKFKSIRSKLANKTAAMLIGPPGVGKTTIVYALARDYNLSVIELNASDVRTEEAVNEKLRETVRNTNLLTFTSQKVKGKLILIDEVDGIHGRNDRGGAAAVKKIISISRYPVIMTCNFKDYRRFGDLYKLSSPLLELTPAKPEHISLILKKIVLKEHIEISSEQIKKIAERSQGDYRSAINDLQALVQGTLKIQDDQLDAINMRRDHAGHIQEMMVNFFQQETIKDAKRTLDKIESKDISFNNIGLWLNENIFNFLTKKEELFYGYQNFAFADKILGYIGRTQDYAHLSYYYDILSGGLCFAKLSSNISSRTSKIKANKTKKIKPPKYFRIRAIPDDEISLVLQKLYRAPLNEIMREIRPRIPLLTAVDKEIRQYFAKEFNVDIKKISKVIRS